MLEKYADVLRTVYKLAVIRNQEDLKHHEEDYPDGQDLIDLGDIIKEHNNTSGLLQFLWKQDMETVKVIQTVMYIGREYTTSETEEEEFKRTERNSENPENEIAAPPLRAKDPERVLREWLADSSGVSEWKDKHLEVDQIYYKMPLDLYLERAFLILDIAN